MTTGEREIDPARLAARIDALPGVDRLREAGEKAGLPTYLVGGAVRDLLLGRERADLDLAVEGDPLALAKALGGELRAHERFGTATVRIGELTLDLARTRTETYPRPGALPEVSPGTLRDDLARRDFTVNAIAAPLSGDRDPIDPHGGIDDLRAGVLRPLHEGSFVDDPTRAVRAARYAARYGFGLEPEAEARLRATDLRAVSRDRVEAELRKLALEPDPAAALERLAGWGLASGDADLVRAALAVLERPEWAGVADRAEVVLAASGVAAGDFGAGTQVRERAEELVAVAPERPSACVLAARGHPGVTLVIARALGAEWLDRYVSEWRHVRLEITGNDLIAAGIPEGPAVGRGLATALAAKLDGEAHGRDEELRVAEVAAGSA